MANRRRLTTSASLMMIALGMVAACSPVPPSPDNADSAPADPVWIAPAEGRADLVAGSQTLLRIGLPDGAAADRAELTVNGELVPGALRPAPDSSIFPTTDSPGYLARVDGLREGDNRVAVTAAGHTAELTLTSHRWGASMISGPQPQPWECTTVAAGLGEPIDEYCNAPTQVNYYYLPAGTPVGQAPDPHLAGFRPYDRGDPPARSDIASITTEDGREIPYVVRYERGTVNRGIYAEAVVAEPDQELGPWSPPPAWKRKVMAVFPGGCGLAQTQGSDESIGAGPAHWQDPVALQDWGLSRGFAVVYATSAHLGQQCNSVVNAETVMSLKQQLAYKYGPIRFTVSYGLSGGAIGPQQIADSYPGLLDGLLPLSSYADLFNPLMFGVLDCTLLHNWFTTRGAEALSPEQRAAIVGEIPGSTACTDQSQWPTLATAGQCAGPDSRSASTPAGVPCDLLSRYANQLGTDTEGRGLRPMDNVGVQYGLRALQRGQVTAQQFVDLNAEIGGLDADGGFQKERMAGDPTAIRRMYQNNLILHGSELGRIPVIDARSEWDLDMHDHSQWVFTRNRLLAHNGNADNHIHWLEWPTRQYGLPSQGLIDKAATKLDEWLSDSTADSSPKALAVAEHKPAGLGDACFLGGQEYEWTADSLCERTFEYQGAARMAAGGPDTNDVIKCQLKPLAAAEYDVTFTAEQWDRLQRTFPSGVCDYSRPGIEQQAPTGPWLTYQNGPDGEPLGPAPSSRMRE